MSLTPIITHDDNDNALPYGEACRRTAQLYTEEADGLDPGEQRDYALARAEAFTAEADRWDSQQEPLMVASGARVFIRPLGDPDTEWTELEGITGVTMDGISTAAEGDPGAYAKVTDATGPSAWSVETSVELSDADAKEVSTMEVEGPERIPNRLVYASDVVPGMSLVTERPCGHPRGLPAMLVGPHSHGFAVSTVLEIRQGEGAMAHLLSAIVLDEDGEQQPCLWHTVELVRIRVDG